MHVRKAFTLIEITLVIALIVLLGATVLAVLNPAKRFAETRNVRRLTDIQSLFVTSKTYQSNHAGAYLPSVQAMTVGLNYGIGTNTSGCNVGCAAVVTQSSCVDFSALVTQGYLGSIPLDPQAGNFGFTGYYVMRGSLGNIVIGACNAELGENIIMQ